VDHLSRRQKRSKRRQRAWAQAKKVACPEYFAKLDRPLNTADGGRTAYALFLRVVCFGSSIIWLAMGYVAGFFKAPAASTQTFLYGVAFVLFVLRSRSRQ